MGTAQRPRLSVHRSHLHLYAQLIDDMAGKTILSCSSLSPEFRKKSTKGGNLGAARLLGEFVAQSAQSAGIKKVVFDRGGYPYHGRVQALADSARAKGLEI